MAPKQVVSPGLAPSIQCVAIRARNVNMDVREGCRRPKTGLSKFPDTLQKTQHGEEESEPRTGVEADTEGKEGGRGLPAGKLQKHTRADAELGTKPQYGQQQHRLPK